MRARFSIVLVLGVLVAAGALAEEKLVYQSNWSKPEQPAGKEWTTPSGWVQTSPNGARTFLGCLREGGASFAMKDLPRHKVVHLEFDLILRGSWDGSSERGHPDRVEVKMKDGRTLLASTFRTYCWHQNRQSYPFLYDSGRTTPTHFGAAEHWTLGYVWAFLGDDKYSADATYHMDWYVPHESSNLEWQIYTRLGKDDRGQTIWAGIDKVKVSVSDDEHEFRDAEWETLIEHLQGRQPLAADRACWQMLRAPGRARAWLRGGPVPASAAGANQGKLTAQVELLANENLEARANAAEALLRLSPEAVPSLKAAAEGAKGDLLKRRVRRIIIELERRGPKKADDYWRERLEHLLGMGMELEKKGAE